MEKSIRPESLHSGRVSGNLLHILGAIGVGHESPIERAVIRTAHHESLPAENDREDLLSARAFERLGIYHPLAATDPELFID